MITQRANDLIDNAAELEQAAINNVVPVLQGMAWRLSYEIKIVPSVKTASGFMQKGAVQKVVVGYDKKGQPKYKSVYNKFAVMSLFINTEKGSHSKFATIVLGPVDWIQFQKANVNLGQVGANISQKTTAGAVVSMQAKPTEAGVPTGEIIAPASVTTPTSTPAMIPIVPIHATGVFLSKNDPIWGTLYKIVNGDRWAYSPWPDLYTQVEQNQLSASPSKFNQNEQKLKERGVVTSDAVVVPFIADRQPGETGVYRAIQTFTEFFGMAPSAGVVAPVVAPVAAQATTLFEYYQAHGQSLPSVEERSKLYEQLALGQAAYYTGTAEQNTKLLAALQGARL